MRLPPKPEYLSVLRAAIGVIAGDISFNYDEIIQLRVAVSEAFQMTIRQVPQEPQVSTAVGLVVHLTAAGDKTTGRCGESGVTLRFEWLVVNERADHPENWRPPNSSFSARMA